MGLRTADPPPPTMALSQEFLALCHIVESKYVLKLCSDFASFVIFQSNRSSDVAESRLGLWKNGLLQKRTFSWRRLRMGRGWCVRETNFFSLLLKTKILIPAALPIQNILQKTVVEHSRVWLDESTRAFFAWSVTGRSVFLKCWTKFVLFISLRVLLFYC